MKALLGRLFLRLMGWQPEGERPTEPRYVLIAAPHTSNWDFPLALALAAVYRLDIRWLGKHTLFRWPFGWLMRLLGGIPIRRHQKNNIVDQLAQTYQEHDELVITVPAEGTRGWAEYWKSGFYHIAHQAGVPVVLGYLDYARKRGGFGPTVHLTGDIRRDMDQIRSFYADKTGKYPECFGPVRLREEGTADDGEGSAGGT